MEHYVFLQDTISLPHMPYSPDLVNADFTLFSQLEIQLKGHYFDTIAVQEVYFEGNIV